MFDNFANKTSALHLHQMCKRRLFDVCCC